MLVKARKGSSRKDKRESRAHKGAQKTSRLTSLTVDDQNMVISVAEELSKIVGINPDTVCKKMPSRISTTEEKLRKRNKCFERFYDSEVRCAETNNFWLGLDSHEPLLTPIDPVSGDSDVDYVLNYAVRFINRAFSKVQLAKADYLYVGPGMANVLFGFEEGKMKQLRTDDREFKFCHSEYSSWIKPHEDYDASLYFTDDIAEYVNENLSIRCGHDVLMTVPKNEDTDRMIGVNNVIGIASQHVNEIIIREALKRCGIDTLTLQQEHKYLAYLGSITGNYQTIDFEMASDTISIALVNILFNNTKSSDKVRNFYKMLRCCRSVSYGDEYIENICHYEKWAPMGHGDTFGTEMLIFTALSNGIQSLIGLKRLNEGENIIHADWRKPTSFGDDVIFNIPSITDAEVRIIERIFRAFGLFVNHEKSFYKDTDFRESCGADFRNGRYVRGFYLKKGTCDATDVIRLINFFTLHYDIGYSLICATFPMFKKLCDSLHLERYVTAPVYIDTGVLSPYIVVPDDIILSADLRTTDVRIVKHAISPMCKIPPFRCIKTMDDILVPQKFGIGNSDLCSGSQTSILEDVPNPIIWIKEHSPRYSYVPEKIRRSGWDRRLRFVV